MARGASGGLLGMRVSDLPIMANIDKKDLILYNYPTDDELKETKVTGLFLGHYLPMGWIFQFSFSAIIWI